MHSFFATCVCLVVSAIAWSQSVQIRDAITDRIIEGASIISHRPFLMTITDKKGNAELSEFKDAQNIEIKSLGYSTLYLSYSEVCSTKMVKLTPSAIEMSEYVVRAAESTKRLNTSKMDRLGAPALHFYTPSTSADLLGISGSVFVQKSQQGGGSPMIRGFSANRLLYTVDGVRMNNAIFRSGNLHNIISLDPFATAFVEILPGPHADMYGSDALGGVMRFMSITPALSDTALLVSGSATTRYASANNEQTIHAQISIGGKKLSTFTSITRNYFGDLRMGSVGSEDYLYKDYVVQGNSADMVVKNQDSRLQKGTAYEQINLMQQWRYAPSLKRDFYLAAHWANTGNMMRYDRHLRRKDGLPRYAEWGYGPMRWQMHQLRMEARDSVRAYDILNLSMAHQYFEESRHSRNLNDPWRENQSERVHTFSINADARKGINNKRIWLYGLETVINTVISEAEMENISAGTKNTSAPRYPSSHTFSNAVYGSLILNLGSKWVVQSGMRINYYYLSSIFDTTLFSLPYNQAEINTIAPSGKIGTEYIPNKNWKIRGGLGSGFRAPNVDDIGKIFDAEPGTLTVPNSRLKPEYAYSGDITITRYVSDLLTLEVGGFYTILYGAMVRRSSQLNGEDSIWHNGIWSGVQALQNAAAAHIYGIEGALEWQIWRGFKFKSRIAWQEGVEEEENGTKGMARHAPPLYGKTVLGYTALRWRLELYALYSGERTHTNMPISERGKTEIYAQDPQGNTWSPSWFTLNLKSMVHLSGNIHLSAGIENLMDIRYRPYSSGIAAPGRNLTVSITGNF